MTIPRPARGVLAAGLALAAVVGLSATIASLRDPAPQRSLEPVVTDGQDAPADVITCERTLPDAPTTRDDVAAVEPVGRVTSTEVVACPQAFDGQVVLYTGEVVGDVLRRTGGAWALVNDDAYALETGPLSAGHGRFAGPNTGLSVWLPDPLPDRLGPPGRADRRGDVVRLRGVVRRADPADGGGLTLRALDVTIVARSVAIDRPVSTRRVAVAAGFVVVAIAVTVAERVAARRR